ncbi:MAG: hypothetical protein LBM98_08465 [Oscillospiraceae bacterium]|nr:hypothetical protein [Oscillospiraceae bacterium]
MWASSPTELLLRIGAKQSSAAVRRYVSLAFTTGLLRTCNRVRIASVPVLRNDGGGRFAGGGAAAVSPRVRHGTRTILH